MGAVLLSTPAVADVISVSFVSVATGVDDGPQDGAFDSITAPGLGCVNNNGYTSFRTAFEFSLSALPAGATINTATLTVSLSNFEGQRAVEVHGYAGDGTVQLADFAVDGLVGSASVDPSGTQLVNFDVTSFVADLVVRGETFAGFDVREEPANGSNFIVMWLDGVASGFLPLLSIAYSTEQIVDMDIRPGRIPNTINPGSRGKIPIAILSSASFDAAIEVDATSLTFGRTGRETSLVFCHGTPEDVNGDEWPDLVCHFDSEAAGFLTGDTQGVLNGKTWGGVAIRGTDSVRIVPEP
jgi:hypothetical protein